MDKNPEISVPRVTVIFPTKNVEETIEHVILTAKKSKYGPQVIVVDAFSSDRTGELARGAGAKVVEQDAKAFPAKGNAMKTGLNEAFNTNADIILFLDADIENLTSDWVEKLVEGCINCDMARGYYERHPRNGAVTKLIAKPMLHIFFPELSHFEQPLSGEVCARKEIWKRLLEKNPPDGWGIDVWFLIETAMLGCQIKEIFLGHKEHTSFEDYREDVGKLAKMAEQVEFTIIKEAIKHGRLDSSKDVKI
jgi:glycosyltransferase involved in cell wall biosynthesis